ncbi:MAG: cyclase family protein [Planctomycetota bacterium]
MSAPLRGLAIGAGYFAQFHLDAWQRVDGAEIVGVCDSDFEKATASQSSFAIENAFADVEHAIEQVKPDFLDIITPPDSHLNLVTLAASKSIPVICQKPLAPDLSTACQIIDVATAANIRLMVHENFRFQPWHRQIKKLLDDGVIGDRLHSLTFRTRTGDGWGENAYLGRQPYFREMPRFLVHETGVHFIDTFRYLAGEVESTYAVLRKLNQAIVGEDTGLVVMRFGNGAVGVWDANRFNESTDENPRLTFGEFLIEGNLGTIRLYGDGRLTIQPLGESEREHPYELPNVGFAGDCVRATQQHFIDCLKSGESFETSGEEYRKTLQVVEAVYVSGAIGQTVDVRNSKARLVDLSRRIDNQMPGASISSAKTISEDGWNATILSLYSHCGTHMDAPCHFVEGGATLMDQRISVCHGPAKVIDLSPVEPGELLTVEKLGVWQNRIHQGDRLLFRTDWHKQFPSDKYRNALPRISLELAEWLVAQKVALIGVEPPSVADVNNLEELTAVHRTLFDGGVTIVEGLVNLDQLPNEIVELVVLPLPITGGDGSPVRAIARVEDTRP